MTAKRKVVHAAIDIGSHQRVDRLEGDPVPVLGEVAREDECLLPAVEHWRAFVVIGGELALGAEEHRAAVGRDPRRLRQRPPRSALRRSRCQGPVAKAHKQPSHTRRAGR